MRAKKYTTQINIKVTIEEKEKLKLKAENCGISQSDFIRKMALESNPVFLSQEIRDEVSELKKHALEIKRTLNLYHEKRKEYAPFLQGVRSIIKKVMS